MFDEFHYGINYIESLSVTLQNAACTVQAAAH